MQQTKDRAPARSNQPVDELWKPPAAVITSLVALVCAVPLGLAGFYGALAGTLHGSLVEIVVGLVVVAAAAVVGAPMAEYMHQPAKRPFYQGLAALAGLLAVVAGVALVLNR